MMTDQDRELLATLTQLNAAITTFSLNLCNRELDQAAHIGMALLLLDMADRTLQHLLQGDAV